MDVSAVARRVASRFVRAGWEGKLVGKDFRLMWDHHIWKLEELPQKGKKQLGVATMDTYLRFGSPRLNLSALIPDNILREQHISASDTYEHVKTKIQQGMTSGVHESIAANPTEKLEWMLHNGWHEERVHYLKVTPEGTDPFMAQGQYFTVKVEWANFSTHSPDSDFQLADPHYTRIDASAAASARKLYTMLKADPTALQHVAWSGFTDWLSRNKIGYKLHFSNWS